MAERWARIKELYQQALTLDPGEHASYLKSICAGDDLLRAEVEELLRCGEKADAEAFLNTPAAPEPEYAEAAVPGQRLGNYEVVSLLGKGGMGQVYEARDIRLGRRIALKLMGTGMVDNTDARIRFLREARSAAALNHPNIATVFDAGDVNGQLYLAMEFIDGQSLRSFLPDAGLTELDAINYGMHIGMALEHAHSRGILHRDVKPENVMIEKSGAVKLVDFGIAKSLPTTETSIETEVTRPGVFVGTLQYAAPEVLVGSPATRESDIYSFGVLLFEMLCGHTPFQGLPPAALAEAVLRGDRVALRQVNPEISEGLAEIVERCISRHPEARFLSVTELLDAMRAVQAGGRASSTGSPDVNAAQLAILEFVNLSRDPSVDWLSTGILETLDSDLRKIEALQVVGRARTQQVLRVLGVNVEETAGLAAIANRLGVKWILTGSFQRAGTRIRVTPRVYRFPGGDIVPTEKVDGDWENLFEVQDQVVRALISTLELQAKPDLNFPATQSLDAYEHYATGRRLMHQMSPDALMQAIQHFEKAIAINPDYALAYSGLGSSHGLRFIHTSDPEALRLSLKNLERAIELDSELGEPYPFLCYAYNRLGDYDKCIASGKKGVELQPDLAQAHYFYAGVLVVGTEIGRGSYQDGMNGILRAISLDPVRSPQWFIAGSGALYTGKHAEAQLFFERALALEGIPNLPFRFVGARTMLGFTQTRQVLWDAARRSHLESLEVLRDAQHVYRDVFIALSACGLGEIELRAGRADQALTRFRHASRIVKEETRMLGNLRLGIRAQAGMAAAYAALGDRDRAEQLLAEAVSKMPGVQLGNWVWDTLAQDLHYSIACAQLRLGFQREALASLSSAIDTGFADPRWLEADPEWESLRQDSDFARLVERVRLIPPLNIDLSRLPPLASGTSVGGSSPPS